MKRILSVDYGDVRTGIAINDPLDITVYGLETIVTKQPKEEVKSRERKILKRLEEIINEYKIDILVLGMPYNENGTESDRTIATKKFMHKLKCKFNTIQIYEQDERFTSMQAEELMYRIGVKKKNKKKVIDQLAAINILESFRKTDEYKKLN